MAERRVLVCGGRDYLEHLHVCDSLDTIHQRTPIAVLIHGDADGADFCASLWAAQAGIEESRYPADWKTHGKSAGPIRNQQMLEEGKPDLVVAFPGGRGTADMVRRSKLAGVPIWQVTKDSGGWLD